MRRNNWQEFEEILKQHSITKLYHFTDRDNLESIINNGGLYSWADCEDKGITIAKPGGSFNSRELDKRSGLQNYVRVSFTTEHPMMYVAMNEDRITNPVILEIDPEVIFDDTTKYADRNATKNGARIGDSLDDFKAIHFNSVKAKKHFDLPAEEQMFFQAEILVKNFIPLSAITNIANFGIPIPAQPNVFQPKNSYTARVDRAHPTAFIFLVDQSVSMKNLTTLDGETMTKSEAVARILNQQLDELQSKCVKANETRHYFDIALIGYSEDAYSAWMGNLEGRDFVSPEEIRENPYETITKTIETKTRRGLITKEMKISQWVKARHDGRWTRLHKALKRAEVLLTDWLKQHSDSFPPCIINITDGEYNGITHEDMQLLANQIKSMGTNDGNVLFFNIHISGGQTEGVSFPATTDELFDNNIACNLFKISSLLPLNYNEELKNLFGDKKDDVRYRAMCVNVGVEKLLKMIKVGTLSSTNFSNSL